MLGLVAESYGVSKNQLAEEMLERELRSAALLLELDIAGTLELLQNYTEDTHRKRDVSDFAEAEAYADDPMNAHMVEPSGPDDPFGVLAAFRK
jgi:hypothetical protein